jgi:hypothetical protein
MDTKRKVCLYGNSVILGSLELSLAKCPHFDVFTVPNPVEENGLGDLEADVIFFDLNCRFPWEAFALLENHNSIKVIGVSPDSNLVKVWSGHQLRELSTSELIKTIDPGQSDIPGHKKAYDGDYRKIKQTQF